MFTFQDYFWRLQRRMLAEALANALDTKITSEYAQDIANELGVDFSKEKFTLEQFRKGVLVELEHKDVTKGDPLLTGKIALAHLRERPDYYEQLEKYIEKKKP